MPVPSESGWHLRGQVLHWVQKKKPKRFRRSDQVSKAPKWCPRRLDPPICRIHGFKDERSAYMDFLWRMEYRAGKLKTISPASFHYTFRTELQLGMTAKQFFDASQESRLHDILPEEVSVGEVIEIDDGLQPYYFYVLDLATVVPLRYFSLAGRGQGNYWATIGPVSPKIICGGGRL